jgi:4,5-dihydroxyphthalate decarboxylase
MLPWVLDEVADTEAIFGGEPFAYGLEANRGTIETLVGYLHRHHMIARRPSLAELFVDVGA